MKNIFGQGNFGSCCDNTWCTYNGVLVLDLTLVNVLSRYGKWKMVIINNNHRVLNNIHGNDSDKYKYEKFYHIFFNVLLWNEYCLYMTYVTYIWVFCLIFCELNEISCFTISCIYWWVCRMNDLFGVIYFYCLIMFWNSGSLIYLMVYKNGRQTVWFRKFWLFFVFVFVLSVARFFAFWDFSVFLKWLENEINHQLLMRLFVFDAPFGRLRR